MTQIKNLRLRPGRLYITLGVSITMAIAATTPLIAQDTVVEGKVKRSDVIERRVSYADLDLESQSNKLILISRVKKAAGKVCNIIHSGEPQMMILESGCTSEVYRNARPQIDLAIANAGSGRHVAINLTAKRGN